MTLYEQAAARIAAQPELRPYRDSILHDGPHSDAHYEWAATCDLAELLSWCRTVTGEDEDVAGLLAYQRQRWSELKTDREGAAKAQKRADEP